jgi:hypothetical protein
MANAPWMSKRRFGERFLAGEARTPLIESRARKNYEFLEDLQMLFGHVGSNTRPALHPIPESIRRRL